MNAEMNMDKEMNTNAKPLLFVFALLRQASSRKIVSNLVFPVFSRVHERTQTNVKTNRKIQHEELSTLCLNTFVRECKPVLSTICFNSYEEDHDCYCYCKTNRDGG